ncbi:MAG: HAD family hydrolase, partial [bacterium]|nr:HAD family hydrolase [bacterium]
EMANPIDKALVGFAGVNGMDLRDLLLRVKRIYDKPFDSENRYMVCGFEMDGMKRYFAKGDPNLILRMCNQHITTNGRVKQMDNEFWGMHLASMRAVNQSNDTVIALAYKPDIADDMTQNFIFLSLLQLENSLQAGAREIIKVIMDKGIRGLLLTGDRPETAGKIAEQRGITKDSKMVLTGGSIAQMELREVARQSSYCSVSARLIPTQKGVLIRLLQDKGQCVGMIGDGVNDGIALRMADVSISFFRNSSPIARKFANILINELNDLSILLASAQRYKNGNHHLKIFRGLTLAAILLGVYTWVFTHIS